MKAEHYIKNPEVLSTEAKSYYLDIERGVPQYFTSFLSKLGTRIYVGHSVFEKNK